MKKYIYLSIAFLVTPFFNALANWQAGLTEAAGFGLPDQDPYNIITGLLEWVLGILTIIAVIAFVISGIMFLTSGGNPEQTTKAKDFVKYSIIGLVASLSGYILINFIDNILNGNANLF